MNRHTFDDSPPGVRRFILNQVAPSDNASRNHASNV
nr:MAG TPA: hypothetical protein [Caudoviricetes sp.]